MFTIMILWCHQIVSPRRLFWEWPFNTGIGGGGGDNWEVCWNFVWTNGMICFQTLKEWRLIFFTIEFRYIHMLSSRGRVNYFFKCLKWVEYFSCVQAGVVTFLDSPTKFSWRPPPHQYYNDRSLITANHGFIILSHSHILIMICMAMFLPNISDENMITRNILVQSSRVHTTPS